MSESVKRLKAWLYWKRIEIETMLQQGANTEDIASNLTDFADDVQVLIDGNSRLKDDNEKLKAENERLRETLEWIARWANGCPANSEYDKGLKAAHDALGSKARAALREKE